MYIHFPFVFLVGLVVFAAGVALAVVAHKTEFRSGWLADMHMFLNLIAAVGLLGGGFAMAFAIVR